MSRFKPRRPSPAFVISIVALIVALGGTAYAAHTINGALIKKHTITGGKLKHKTLTGYQIRTNKLGIVPAAVRAAHTYWAVVSNPAGPGNTALARASDAGMAAIETGGAVTVTFPANITGCADVAARNNTGTSNPNPGYAQTNISPVNPNAIEVHTRNQNGNDEDADFHLIVVCP
jgi:hypothetical protein